MRRRLACLLAVAALLTAPACSDDDNGNADNTTTTERGGSTSTSASDTTGSTTPASDTSQVTMKDFTFDPKEIDVPEGGVGFRVANQGAVRHTFTVDSLNVDEVVEPGSQAEVQVAAPESAVPFYCRFHRGSGMEGTLRPAA